MNDLPDKYIDVEVLKPGKNASVFSATNGNLNRKVFLKFYQFKPDDVLSALREPQLLTKLDHANLAKIYDADKIGQDQMLLEMELLRGGSLQDVIDKAAKSGDWPSLHQVLRWGHDMASGLAHLHERKYVHRDGKPANVMVRKANGHQRAVFTDLGLAARVGDDGRAFASQHARLYRPPEVWDGHGYSFASDVYQVGIIVFQLLGGRLDYELADVTDVELAIKTRDRLIFDFTALHPYVERLVLDLLDKCICPEAQRIVDMPSLAFAFNNLIHETHDWNFKRTKDGFNLRRRNGSKLYDFGVSADGNKHTVLVTKSVNNGQPRRCGDPVAITHNSLHHCRKFQQLLASDL